jgi:hypothetical protein
MLADDLPQHHSPHWPGVCEQIFECEVRGRARRQGSSARDVDARLKRKKKKKKLAALFFRSAHMLQSFRDF